MKLFSTRTLFSALTATFILFSLSIFAGKASADPSQLRRFEITDATAKGAVCNDLSPAVYYYRPGIDRTTLKNSNKWVIYLEPGESCKDLPSCVNRWENKQRLMTSTLSPASMNPGGIFSLSETKNPNFNEYNHVIAHYCSSDKWSGTATQTDPKSNQSIAFNGNTIIQALLADLTNPASAPFNQAECLPGICVPIADNHQVIVSGSSGVRMTIDNIAKDINQNFGLAGTKVFGLIDSTFNPNLPLTNTNWVEAYSFWGAVVDESCLASMGTKNGSACMSLSVLIKGDFINTPLFIFEDRIDYKAMKGLFLTPDDLNDQRYFARIVRALFEWAINSTSANSGPTGGFTTCEGIHNGVGTPLFYTTIPFTDKGPDMSISEVLKNWIDGEYGLPHGASEVHALSTADGLNTCPGTTPLW